MCFAAMSAYSLPRSIVYFLTVVNIKARVQWYFRTRIVTFIILFIILGGCFLFCFFNADELA